MATIKTCDICGGNVKKDIITLQIVGDLENKKAVYDDGYSKSDYVSVFMTERRKYDVSISEDLCMTCTCSIIKYINKLRSDSIVVQKELNTLFVRGDM